MPNWVKGNIRFRGKTDDILNFLKNELVCVGVRLNSENLADRIAVFKPDVSIDDEDDICISWPDSASYEKLGSCCFHIEGTERNFLDRGYKYIKEALIPDFDTYDDREDERIILFDCFKAAWNIDPEPYEEFSKKYNIDIRIDGWEKGMEFYINLIIECGQVTKRTEIKYDDWAWNSVMPQLGG